MNRLDFLQMSSYGLGGLFFGEGKKGEKPIVLSTWDHGIKANARAWEILSKGGRAIDAVEAGVMVVESDFTNRSVGLGGMPDREGITTLDACIMDEHCNCGSVAFVQNFENPIAIARCVMDKTPHVMMVGKGAEEFALAQGFKRAYPNVPERDEAYLKWKKESKYQPIINIENHDTIGMIAMDVNGNLSGSCTTSGLAFKMHGRVGDSPIIGAGLFVDNEVGAACATGLGEVVIKVAGSHSVVELMRQGYPPERACKEVVERVKRKVKNLDGVQIGFLALNKKGQYGGYAIYNGFNFALRTNTKDLLVDTKFDRKW